MRAKIRRVPPLLGVAAGSSRQSPVVSSQRVRRQSPVLARSRARAGPGCDWRLRDWRLGRPSHPPRQIRQTGRGRGAGGHLAGRSTSRFAGPGARGDHHLGEGSSLPTSWWCRSAPRVSFPNHDPFNHNVFSLSEENPFDSASMAGARRRSVRFSGPGIVRVYCNVHAQMSALVVVRDDPWYAQPASDGSFTSRRCRRGIIRSTPGTSGRPK